MQSLRGTAGEASAANIKLQCIYQVRSSRCNVHGIYSLCYRTALIIAGWGAFGFLAYRVAGNEVTNSVYNPFEILGIGMSASEKEIKSHYKKLSKVLYVDHCVDHIKLLTRTLQPS